MKLFKDVSFKPGYMGSLEDYIDILNRSATKGGSDLSDALLWLKEGWGAQSFDNLETALFIAKEVLDE